MAPLSIRDDSPCPCGSRLSFAACCARALRGIPAATPEALMRSRYTANVIGDAAYLLQTWHPGTAPESIDLDAALRWTGLQIVAVDGGGDADARGVVEFAADWRSAAGRGTLRERSRFVRQSGRWWYLDGVVTR
ncbi:MAG: SEC-C domain-containing protein [Microbacterium sp.]|nr:SEC-C domain-containing protein [Microbacterium sp.]MBN9182642.1 SEC-C domain-containing protein [Microbacterium sp.]